MTKELISIVVPVYNVEKYLEECIDSIINQTYKNIEIILVDDGSRDNCGKICDNYASKDNRIIVIHKENGGLSDARNRGIDNASGKYITFIDSDDYVEKDYIKLLYEAIIKNNVLISQCGIKKVNDKSRLIENVGYDKNLVKNGKKMIIELNEGKWENTVVWNKMYLRDLFNEIRFPKGKIHEDEFTTYKILYTVKDIAIINEFLYNYRQNNKSIMGEKFNIKRLDLLEAKEQRLNFFKQNNEEELYASTLKSYLENIRYIYMNVKTYIKNNKILEKDLLNKYRKTYKKIIHEKNFKIWKKVKWSFFYIFPDLYYKIKRYGGI